MEPWGKVLGWKGLARWSGKGSFQGWSGSPVLHRVDRNTLKSRVHSCSKLGQRNMGVSHVREVEKAGKILCKNKNGKVVIRGKTTYYSGGFYAILNLKSVMFMETGMEVEMSPWWAALGRCGAAVGRLYGVGFGSRLRWVNHWPRTASMPTSCHWGVIGDAGEGLRPNAVVKLLIRWHRRWLFNQNVWSPSPGRPKTPSGRHAPGCR